MADLRPGMADFRSERADLRPDRADFRPEVAYIRPKMADFRAERPDEGDGWMNGQTDGRTKVSFWAAAQKGTEKST